MMAIPTITEYHHNTTSNNQIQNEENRPLETDTCYTNGDCSVGNELLIPTQTLNEDYISSSSALMGEFIQMLPSSLAGHRSDQSASEDSSLTDSDRTIVGGNPDEYQMSSPSLSPQSHDVRYTNDLFGEDEIGVESSHANKASLTPSISDSIVNKIQSDNCYFEELDNKIVNDERHLTILVDKRMSLVTFKQHLEKHIRVPHPYLRCVLNTTQNGDDPFCGGSMISSLQNLEDDSTLHVRLVPPRKPGTLRGCFYHLNFNCENNFKSLDKFNIDENSTVAETKRKLLQNLRILHKMDLCFERCLIRTKFPNGPGKVCSNEQTWKELDLQDNWQLILQELSANEFPDAPYRVMVRNYVSGNSMAGSLREIVFTDKFSVADLKTKISETSNIPVENLVLGEQWWSKALGSVGCYLSSYVTNTDIDWDTIKESMNQNEMCVMLAEEGRIIYYKDNREDTNELPVIFDKQNSRKEDYSRYPKREKTLTIRVGNPKPIPNSDSSRLNDVAGYAS